MIAICENCFKEYKTLPSWYHKYKQHYCSNPCRLVGTREARSKSIAKAGEKTRFSTGNRPNNAGSLPKGKDHYAWKGEKVGYRGLHYWLERIKGKSEECVACGLQKSVQWANIDNVYTRNPDDYIPMCSSCHKNYDLALKAQATEDGPTATR